MAHQPKRYTPKFKFQLVLEVLQGDRSAVERGRIYGVNLEFPRDSGDSENLILMANPSGGDR